jgi:hypothetical protein
MKLFADLTKKAMVNGACLKWVPSPASGVDRCMLDRDGAEVARATTIVKFAPKSSFPHHTHGGGEEYFVLQGTFHDSAGAYGLGSYVRNPIGTSHAPWTEDDGCTILVKLRQMHSSDIKEVAVDTTSLLRAKDGSTNHGASNDIPLTACLYSNEVTGEQVFVEAWPAGTSDLRPTEAAQRGGEELFVVEGTLQCVCEGEEVTSYPRWSWLRFPPSAAGSESAAAVQRSYSSQEGCRVLRKVGHLLREIQDGAASADQH